MRRRAKIAVAAALTAGAAAATVVAAGLPAPESSAAADSTPPPATADVRRETLVDSEDHDGSLGYGETSAVVSRVGGTVTRLPAADSTVKRGRALYHVDNDPVVLLYGSLPAYRDLTSGTEGADVLQFEKNLWALGYRGFTVDDEYTSATAGAVEDWQDDLGLTGTGRVELGRVVYRPGEVRVDSHTTTAGTAVQPGTEMLRTTGTRRMVTVELEAADQRLARKGAPVKVTLPDGRTAGGKISQVETYVEEAENPAGEDVTKLRVSVTFDEPPTGMDEAAVTVAFNATQRENVLTVPVHALLALAEGGYGVEVVDGSATRVVAVGTGLFANGRVEISGGGLAEGMKVGVPS